MSLFGKDNLEKKVDINGPIIAAKISKFNKALNAAGKISSN